ncbi:MAG: efflux RND transporter permease subunit [Thermohalobaculum sp.]|nr:efflux RND transporter permease subunit [Thermohalobaculum sp.]
MALSRDSGHPGAFETEQGFRYALATSGVFEDWERVGDVPIATPTGEILYVRNLARLVRGNVDPVRKPVFFDGRPAVTLGVSMAEGEAIQTFDAALQERLAEIRGELPLGLSLDLVTHQPPIVAASVAQATENLLQTIATVLGVVILFLGIRAGPEDVAPVRARAEAWMAAQLSAARGWTEWLFLGSDPPGTVQIRIKGDDIDALLQAGRAVEAAFAAIEGTREIRSDWASPVLQLNVLIDQARARRGELAPSAVARMLQTKFDGTQVTDHREGDLSIPVVLRARPEDRASIDDLAGATVLSASGVVVPLLQVADLGGELQPWVARRHQQERALTISAVNPGLTAPLPPASSRAGRKRATGRSSNSSPASASAR